MHGAGHILEVFYLLLAAQLMAYLFRRLGQPVVIGEVLAGILVGPALLGWVHEGEILEFLAELGAIFLLFMVGLETRLRDILAVGKEAFLVAVLGVAFPFVGGYLFGLQIGFQTLPSLFLGTALVATSVGITARVLQELGVLSRPYARIILGAAVIDDVLGLIVLAVVNGVAKTGAVEFGAILQLILLSLAFVGVAVALAPLFARLPLDRLPVGSPVGFALAFGVGMAALAATIGLAPIVGAFLGGMLLAELREKYKLEEPIFAIEGFLAPIFFAMVGVRLELAALVQPATLVAGAVVSVIAILGKVLGGFLGALTQGYRAATVVGVGMAPRGEVGLIVAALGLAAGAVNEEEYAIVLFMVVATTLFAPLALKPLIAWAERARRVGGD
ncbi:Kef-type K+ transport system, membrane component [Thermus oshimai JL-2]|uniref:Kef-type K+ transport system, membrane component n=1 Tax=Thermus oshimai JL-2 TaxID=751945 RepID=K7QUA7_THEOS|nr:cation:proton antiporter [Thermus oshimai]AFV75761.1 Kef-type K+ transport system, membrane component [Thermus oshimai JL-2]